MNERIRELALQANGPNPFYGTLKNQMTLLGDDAVERFAELIIRECAEYAEHELDMAGYKKKFMLKHFGVEE